MIKRGMLLAVFCLLLALPSALATLSCSVKASCALGEVEMLGMSSLSNGHAALPGSVYANKVCCTGLSGLSNAGGTAFLNLTSSVNAHAEKITGAAIGANAARIASSGPMDCVYQASCPSQYICLASIEKNSNAHVGDCTAYPSNKICCGCADSSEVSQPQFCSDGIDNDCDGLTDCADPECDGSVGGRIENAEQVPLDGVLVRILRGTTIVGSQSSASGQYSMSVPCSLPGTYTLALSHPDYASTTKLGVVVNPNEVVTVNFIGADAVAKADACESDCTFPASNIVHSSCDGVNGCSFFDALTAFVCDNAQPGWAREYNESHMVSCPNGPLGPKSTQQATVRCKSDICSVASSPVLYNGKQVKMVVVVSGK